MLSVVRDFGTIGGVSYRGELMVWLPLYLGIVGFQRYGFQTGAVLPRAPGTRCG